MKNLYTWVAALLFVTLAISVMACTSASSAGTVTVVTSLSQEMMRAYRLAFERQHPGIRLEIVAKSTAELLREVEQRPAGKRPDVVWASSIEAFVLLAETPLYGLWTGLITAAVILYNFAGVWAMARILLPRLLGRRGKALVAAVDGWLRK